MANKHTPMPVSDRAKQFMPFAALKGLPEALAEKEKPSEPRRELSDDMSAQLNDALRGLRPGQVATAVFYRDQQYVQLTGTVSRVDFISRVLEMDGVSIPTDNLFRLICE